MMLSFFYVFILYFILLDSICLICDLSTTILIACYQKCFTYTKNPESFTRVPQLVWLNYVYTL